jgi:uncharacterized protein YutE (UPF0331/DUF86 family)
MLENYVDALRQHVNETVEDLDSIHEILQTRSWTRVERKGAERLLQVLVEASIGVSRHWLKQQGKTVPPDAYAVFEKLTELQWIPPDDSEQWHRIVGMRNAIVHDYLNMDEKVIRSIVTQKMYLKLRDYALTVCAKLS